MDRFLIRMEERGNDLVKVVVIWSGGGWFGAWTIGSTCLP